MAEVSQVKPSMCAPALSCSDVPVLVSGVMSPATARRTQKERKKEAERRLIEAAAELIGESGTASLTMVAIGERAGYSRGIVGHHFGSKAALVERLVEHVHREFFDLWAEALSDDESPAEQLGALLGAFRDLLIKLPPIHHAFLVLWAGSAAGSPQERKDKARSDRLFRERIAKILKAGVETGEFRNDINIPALAAVVAGTLRGVALQHLIDPAGLELAGVFGEIDESLRRSLAHPPGAVR